MKKNITLLVLLFSLFVVERSYSQQVAEAKVNLLLGAVAIVNPSLEVGCSERSSIVIDYVGAFAEENYMGTGYPFVISMGLFGYRHYLKREQGRKGFFVEGNFGFDVFRMDREVIPLITPNGTNDVYDVGYGVMIGGSCGYKYNISERWSLEASLTGGWHHARHEGYNYKTQQMEYAMNSTAEWTIFKGGIYLGYKFGAK